MKKIILIVTISFVTFFVLFFSQNHYFEYQEQEISFGTEIALTVNGSNTTTFPKKESNLKIKNISCNEGIGYWDYSSWSLRVRNVTNTKVKCNIDFVSEYHETILNGTDPVLKDNLIPVTIENDGTVKRAKMGSEWYSYEKKMWANAIILENDSKTYYEGEVIPESNIESYFVWIPRYKYKIFNEGNYPGTINTPYVENSRSIDIVFENKSTAISNGSTVGSYLTHPAFTSFNSNGFWVGKFETGYKGAKTYLEAWVNTYDTSKIEIKPEVYAWNDINVSNAHLNSYNYQRSLDSHLIKNMEWGAITYLSHSKYGTTESVRINNTMTKVTGRAATNEPTCYYDGTNISDPCLQRDSVAINEVSELSKMYNTSIGYLGSTTANISGIYDMSGGSFEYTMAVMKDVNGNLYAGRDTIETSGFKGPLSNGPTVTTGIDFPISKYIDVYPYNVDISNFTINFLGDATKELGPIYTISNRSGWHEDTINSIYLSSPYYMRGVGYYYGTVAGIFGAGAHSGGANGDISYRIVLAP